MKRLLWLPFLLIHLAGTGNPQQLETCLHQPKNTIWKKIGEEAVLRCTVRSNCPPWRLEWFIVKESSHQQLHVTGRHNLSKNTLHIKSLNVNDTGTYLCAASIDQIGPLLTPECCLPFVGEGTTLIVGERPKLMAWKILLWLSFTLLAIYSLALVMLIILRKHGCNLTSSKTTSKTETQNSLRKKTQFRDVLQELHSRANVNRRKQSTSRNGSQVEAASVDGNISSEDIYQNV